MKKKRYTKPTVIDLGKQSPNTIYNGLLSWKRNESSADEKDANEESVASTACCKSDSPEPECCGINKDSDKS
jgi:hypothetical protein